MMGKIKQLSIENDLPDVGYNICNENLYYEWKYSYP